MADSTSIEQPFPIFFDKVGKPLDSGYVYIGEDGKNPQTNPIQTFWDEALTQPAVQPIRTINGYYSRYGTPSKLYISGSACSITVLDKNKLLVFSDLKSNGERTSDFGFSLWRPISGGYAKNARVTLENGDIVISTIPNNTANPNVDMTGWVLDNLDSQIKTWSGRTQEAKNKENISITDFYKLGDISMSEALNRAFLQTKSLFVPSDEFIFLQDHIIDGDDLELWGDGLLVAKSLNFLKFTGNNIKINGISLEAFNSDSMINSKLLSVSGGYCKTDDLKFRGNNRAAVGIETTGTLNEISNNKLKGFYSYNGSTQAIRSATINGSIIKGNEIWDLNAEKEVGNTNTASSRAIYHVGQDNEVGRTIISNNIIRNVFGVEGDAIHVIFNNGGAHLKSKTTVKDNNIDGFSRRAIKIQAHGVNVRKNDVYNSLSKSDFPNLNTAIDVQYSSDCQIVGNTVETKEMACIQTYGGDTEITPRCKSNVIKDNILKLNAPKDLNSYALYAFKTDESVIKNNTITSYARAIAVADSSYNKVSDNELFGGHAASLGIYVTPTSIGNVVKDNDGMNFACASFVRNQGPQNIVKDNYTKLGVCAEGASTATASLYQNNINNDLKFTINGDLSGQFILNGGFNLSDFSTSYATSFYVTAIPSTAYPNKRFSRGDKAYNQLPSAAAGSVVSWVATTNGVGAAAGWVVSEKVL